MSENVGSIYYEVDAKTDGLLKAQQDAGNITKKIANSLGLVETSTKGMSAEFKRVKAATDPAFASLVKMEKEISVITTEFNEGRISGEQYRKTIDALTGKLGVTAKSTTPLQKGLDTTTVKTNKMSNSIRQASMQLSQVAQQGSVTGNYLQALAIQLPDLALGFGTIGIIAGALAGSLAIPLYNAIVGVDERTKEYNKTIQDTIAGLKSVRLEAVQGAIEELDRQIEKATNRNEELKKSLSEPIVASKNNGIFGDDTAIQQANQFRLAKEQKKLNKELIVNEEALIDLKRQRSKIEGEKTPEQETESKVKEALKLEIEDRQKAAARIIEQTRKQFQDEQTLADEQLEMRLTAIDDAQISIAEKNQAIEEAKALHVQKLADIDAKQTANEKSEAMKRIQVQRMQLAAYTQLGGALADAVAAAGAENTAIGKALFLANQALAVANIIVSTNANAAAAPGGVAGPVGAAITSAGYATAAVTAGIAVGQTFSGRQTGGPTEAGTPYRVGESGPELFTSGGRQFLIGGEKGNVTPNNQLGGGMSAPQVNVNVVNNTASNVSVSQEQDGNNVTIQMLVADFAEGGPVSRAMSNSYSTKRKTT
ncbi:hypothetical protein [uncultured Alteromonas sp.]|uniref:hypothetical protein n=1 Tax=uncultured Alteromonas sp. TaxID=179113 RepID=UPI0030EBA303|tara:strand:+ start:8075 stop:9862 length:1788 start_codon:yes stop_codon:yes gene_type:complete